MSDSPEHVSRSGSMVESASSLTPEERAAWRVLCEKATAGPWTSEGLCLSDSSRGTFISDEQFYSWVDWTEADAAFCAAARSALPRLIDALEAERAKVKRLRVFAQGIAGDQDLEPGYWTDAQKALEETE